MPNAVLIGEVTFVCSPWHRTWHSKAVETTTPAMSTDLSNASRTWSRNLTSYR